MFQLIGPLTSKSVLSLRSGGVIASLESVIINPNNLKIEGWYVLDSVSNKRLVLLTKDIRQIAAKGFIVDDHEVLSEISELIRLKEVLDLKFELIGKQVLTQGKKKLGKVSDYSFDDDSFFVQKLYVSQSIVKSFSGGNLAVDRSQILEITNQKVVVADASEKETAGAVMPAMTT